MKKILSVLVIVLCASLPSQAWNLRDALKGIGSADSTESTTSKLGAMLGNLLSTDRLTLSQIQGTWHYAAPAVTFRTSNLLKKAGGSAASATIVEKLAPIYKRTGFDQSVLTVNADSTFTLTAGKVKLKGNVTTLAQSEDSDANFLFTFTLGGKMNIGQLNSYVTKSANGSLSVMFDVTKLITLMETVGRLSSNSTVNSAVKLLKSYDGLCAGFEMKPAATK